MGFGAKSGENQKKVVNLRRIATYPLIPMQKYYFILLFALAALCGRAQSLEATANHPTGYLVPNYCNGSNTIKSIDGVLYMVVNDVPVVLVRYPADNPRTSYEVPATVWRIANNAFQGAKHLKTLKLHNEVAGRDYMSLLIGETAFNDAAIENFIVLENDDVTASIGLTPETDAASRREVARYDVQGRPVESADDGVQIVRYADGTAEKVIRCSME